MAPMAWPRRLVPLLLLVAVLAPAASADWPQFHNDARKTGAQTGTEYQIYRDVWWNVKAPKNATIETSPVVADDVVIVGGSDKVLRAYDAASGKAKWNYTMTDRVVSSPAIHNGRVYAVDIKGSLVKLDLQTGVKYATAAVGATLAPVTLDEGKLFIGTEAGEMKAFEVESTEYAITALWTFSVTSFRPDSGTAACVHPKGEVRSAAAVHNGIVYFGAMNNYVYAINEESEPDGTIRAQWFNTTGDIVLASPAVDFANSQVYFASYDGRVRAFSLSVSNPASCGAAVRAPTWSYAAPSNAQLRSSPATDGTRIYVGTNTGRVLAITVGGAEVWNRATGDIVVSSPAVSNGVVVVGSDDRNLYWLSATNGSILKQFTAQSAIKASPALDGARTFAASFDGTVYMFGPEIPTRPDLIVTRIAPVEDGVRVTVKNQGDASSSNTTVRLLRGGTFVANMEIGGIAPGQTWDVSFPLTLDATSTFKAIVDPDGTMTESVESNNEKEQKLSPPATGSASPTPGDGGDGGGGGFKIPGPGLVITLAVLALALLAVRRRR